MTTSTSAGMSAAQGSHSNWSGTERRINKGSRRQNLEERRDPDRVAEDMAPRRNPEHRGRRLTD